MRIHVRRAQGGTCTLGILGSRGDVPLGPWNPYP